MSLMHKVGNRDETPGFRRRFAGVSPSWIAETPAFLT
jgi:hypothetical protein